MLRNNSKQLEVAPFNPSTGVCDGSAASFSSGVRVGAPVENAFPACTCTQTPSGVLGGYTWVYGVYQSPGFFHSVYLPQRS